MTGGDDLLLVGRMVGGLIVVLVLVAISARLARRSRRFGGGDLRVLERVGLSRDSQVAVVEVAGRRILIGVGPQGVSMLSHLDDDPQLLGIPALEAQHPEAAEPPQTPQIMLTTQAPQAPQALQAPGTEATGVAEPAPRPAPRVRDEAPMASAVRLPAAVRSDDFPDLASALRAAGRTTQPENPPAPVVATQPVTQPSTQPSTHPPTTRAEARSLERRRGAVPQQRTSPQRTSPQRTSPQRTGQPAAEQAGGSVLDPATWRKGLEALRELTVRRG